jgi:hypothetical protein
LASSLNIFSSSQPYLFYFSCSRFFAERTQFFYKQKVEDKKKISLPVLDGQQWAEMPGIGME